ncbi:DNA internalization-related competence protein ComEC/Rec2 [Jeotgalibacillus sp. R-1-5s-1]|uniref:DNA internalization-related competence protein ComEC/Rec2 n=1 Tax=Jeotgalibacillus sp. R-1-5s-1 TaxID=2555897 RepID=UPI00106C127E|nr:DNA internalization-related competence protein ComEC/Rec2 [Jeotgalibacillus sp. R-1-5s-1]TFD92350.1 DNA internalization-related competence protein ComEC/Rec2 [Jeotgalibacillus sp. R-1-5s-1]
MRPFLPAVPAALIGVLAGHFHLWMYLVIPLVILMFIKKMRWSTFILVAVVMVFFYIRSDFYFSTLTSTLDPSETSALLKITSPFKNSGDYLTAEAQTSEKEKVILRLSKKHTEAADLFPAECVWTGNWREPSEAVNFNGFDYQKHLYLQNIHWIFHAEGFSECEKLSPSFMEKLLLMRERGISHMKDHFPESLYGISYALLFGDRSLMKEEHLIAYQKLGIIHLLAISGMHVGLVCLLIWKVLLRLQLTRESITILLFILLPLYAVMTGASPPVLRASGIVLTVLAVRMMKGRMSLIEAFSVVICFHLFLMPAAVMSPGFQLSYAVSLSIILSSKRILQQSSSVIAVLKVTGVAQLGALPFLLWHFYEISIASFFANLIYIPFYTLFLLPVLLLLYGVSFVFPSAVSILLVIPDQAVRLFDHTALLFSEFPYAVLVTGKPAVFMLFILVISQVVIFSFLEKRKYGVVFSFIMLLCIFVFLRDQINPDGTVTFIDVGQGDSILIDLPFDQGTYLIDTGGAMPFSAEDEPFKVGKEIIVPFLKSRGITSIDLLILTHHDWDHIGGAEDIAEEIHIKEVWTSEGSPDKKEMKELLDYFYEKNIPVFEQSETFAWKTGDAEFKLIHPGGNLEGNNNSLVLHAVLGGVSWLFTGDIEEEAERSLIGLPIRADVLKVAHHGSNTSTTSEFLSAVNPDIAVISAGRNNRYGHPHPDVLTRLEDQGTQVIGTYSHGAIEFRYRKNNGTFHWMLPYAKGESEKQNKKEPNQALHQDP